MKKEILKISVLFVIFVTLFFLCLHLSYAADLGSSWEKDGYPGVTDHDLAAWTADGGWFDWGMTGVVGKQVLIYEGDYSRPTIREKGAYCIHNEVGTELGGAVSRYTINNIVDVDTGAVESRNRTDGNSNWVGWPGGIISYGTNGNGIYWSTSNAGAEIATRLAYLTTQSFSAGEMYTTLDTTNGMYKRTIHDTVLIQADNLQKIGINSAFKTGTASVASLDNYSGTNSAAMKNAKAYSDEVKQYQFKAQTASKTPDLQYSGGKTYAGPFRVRNVKGTISSIKTSDNNYTAKGISTSLGGAVSGINAIPDNKDFYVVFDGTINSKITINITKSYHGYMARMYFLSGKQGSNVAQNIMVYKGVPKTMNCTLSFSAEPSQATLKITKKDGKTNLKGVKFTVQYQGTASGIKNPYVKKDGTYTSTKTTLTTDSNGIIEIKNLKAFGNYKIVETENPNYQYEAKPNVSKTQNVPAGSTKTVAFTNEKVYGELEISKLDKNSNQVLNGIQFKIRNSDNQYILTVDKDKMVQSYTTDQAKAKVFTTGVDGVANKDGKIYLKNLKKGTYYVEEVGVGDNWQYEVSMEPTKVTLESGKKNTSTIYNEKKYINVSGYVWEDAVYDDGKETLRNDLYLDHDKDKNDRLLAGVTVRFVNGSKIEAETTTNASGAYRFDKMLIASLPTAHLEFSYNGLIYRDVTTHLDKANGSKAKETANKRDEFDQKFTTVESAGENSVITKDNQGNNGYEVSYDKKEGTASSSIREEMNQCIMTSSTKEAGYSLVANDTGNITSVNLGLYRKVQTDLALMQDIDHVVLQINGYGHLYRYGSRFETSQNTPADQDPSWNVGVKFGDKYRNGSYKRPIYQADAEFNDAEHQENNLKVTVTYRIAMKNEEALPATVKTVVDYYDSRYGRIQAAGTQIDEKGNLSGNLAITEQGTEGKYNKAIIETNALIQPQQLSYFYLQFDLPRETVVNILLAQKDPASQVDSYLNNVVEINSYGCYYDEAATRTCAAVDKDSVPGNAVPGDTSSYEDDTDIAPPLELVLATPRQVSGTVFEDKDPKDTTPSGQITQNEARQGETRQGNGQYDPDTENGVGGVKVELIKVNERGEITGEVAKIFNETGGPDGKGEWTNAECQTSTEGTGKFTITGFVPGEYVLKYTWGDGTVKIVNHQQVPYENVVENYKATVYDKARYTREQADKHFYKQNENTSYTHALDDYTLRQTIDNELNTNTNTEVAGGKGYNYTTQVTERHMNSSTPIMQFLIDYQDRDIFTITNLSYQEVAKAYEVKNINFGIIERPRQRVTMDKVLTKLTLTLANGQTLLTAQLDENGNLVGNYLTQMPPNVGPDGLAINNGFAKIELDSELIQGTTVEMEYRLTVTNRSELDYRSQEFYQFGNKQGEVITITPTRIIDYLDTKSNFIAGDPTNVEYRWEALTLKDLKSSGRYKGIVSSKVVNSKDIEDTQIYVTDYMEYHGKKLAPADNSLGKTAGSESALMKVSKVLASEDDANFDNQAEIILIDKPGGAKTTNTPGNYIPNKTNQETDDSTTQEIIIAPSTGENKSPILPITLLIILLVALGILLPIWGRGKKR